MRKCLFFLIAALLLCGSASAQATIAVSAAHIQGLNGTPLASGSLCFQATDSSGNNIGIQVSGGGIVVTQPYCTAISSGSISTFNVPNPATGAPLNFRYRITISQGPRTIATFPGVYLCLSSGACGSPYTFSFDTCLSTGACVANPIPITTGPAGPPGIGLPCVGSIAAYSSGTTYALNNCTSYGGVVYISLTGSNTGNTPSSSPTYWGTTGSAATSAGTAFNVTNSPYNAVGDGTTDNTAALASVFTATNALSLTNFQQPTVYFPCQAGKGCTYLYGDTGGASPINPTISTTIQCDPGVVLLYSGSHKGLVIGPPSLTAPQNPFPIYRVTGCQLNFSSSSTSATDMTYVTPYTQIEFDHNNCTATFNWPSTAWCMDTGGENYWVYVHDNNCTQINAFANCFWGKDSGDGNTQSHMIRNYGGCAYAATPVGTNNCTVTTGIGIWSDGVGDEIVGNDFDRMTPDIIGGGAHSSGTVIINNQLETSVTGTPCIGVGDPTDSGAAVLSWTVRDNFCYAHEIDGVSGTSFMGMLGTNDLVLNFTVNDNHVYGLPSGSVMFFENELQGQTNNKAMGNQCSFASSIFSSSGVPCFVVHALAGGTTTPEPWLTSDHLNYNDAFNRTNGTVTFPWLSFEAQTLPTISSDTLTCASVPCAAMFAGDLPNNQIAEIELSTAPTGTDNVAVFTRVNFVGSSTENEYNCYYVNGTGIQLGKTVSNSFTQLGSTYTYSASNGDWLILESNGAVQTCSVLNSSGLKLAITAIDSSISAGYAGLHIGHGTSPVIGAFIAKGLP